MSNPSVSNDNQPLPPNSAPPQWHQDCSLLDIYRAISDHYGDSAPRSAFVQWELVQRTWRNQYIPQGGNGWWQSFNCVKTHKSTHKMSLEDSFVWHYHKVINPTLGIVRRRTPNKRKLSTHQHSVNLHWSRNGVDDVMQITDFPTASSRIRMAADPTSSNSQHITIGVPVLPGIPISSERTLLLQIASNLSVMHNNINQLMTSNKRAKAVDQPLAFDSVLTQPSQELMAGFLYDRDDVTPASIIDLPSHMPSSQSAMNLLTLSQPTTVDGKFSTPLRRMEFLPSQAIFPEPLTLSQVNNNLAHSVNNIDGYVSPTTVSNNSDKRQENNNGESAQKTTITTHSTKNAVNNSLLISQPYIGLPNHGVTCYFNAVVQVLYHSLPFRQRVMNLTRHNEMSRCLASLFGALNEKVVDTEHMKRKTLAVIDRMGHPFITDTQLLSNQQQDAHEAILKIINSFDHPEETEIHKIYSELFQGVVNEQLHCDAHHCTFAEPHTEDFIQLKLEFAQQMHESGSVDVQRMLNTLMSKRSVQLDRKCPTCSHNKWCKQDYFVQLPSLLMVQIKRFSIHQTQTGQCEIRKKSQRVTLGDGVIDMSVWLADELLIPRPNCRYDLYAVVIHTGQSHSGGHYYCFINTENGIWYKFDDVDVQRVSFDKIVCSRNSNENNYLLFYRNHGSDGTIMSSINKAEELSTISSTSSVIDQGSFMRTHASMTAIGEYQTLHQDFVSVVPAAISYRAYGVLPDGSCGRLAVVFLAGTVSTHIMKSVAFEMKQQSSARPMTQLVFQAIDTLSGRLLKWIAAWDAERWQQTIPFQLRADHWIGAAKSSIDESYSLERFKRQLSERTTFLDYSLFYIACQVYNMNFIVIQAFKTKFGWNKRTITQPTNPPNFFVVRYIPGYLGKGHYEPIININGNLAHESNSPFITQLQLIADNSDDRLGTEDLEKLALYCKQQQAV